MKLNCTKQEIEGELRSQVIFPSAVRKDWLILHSAVEERDREIARLRKAMEETLWVGQHAKWCFYRADEEAHCDCFLANVRQALQPKKDGHE